MGYDNYGGGGNKQGGWGGNKQGGGWSGKQGGGQGGGFKGKPKEDNSPVVLYRPYVACGNKDLPDNLRATIKQLTSILEGNGYTLRTGGVAGTEEAFEQAVVDTKYKLELILPWFGFKSNQQATEGKTSKFCYMDDPFKARLLTLTREHHLSFDTLPDGVKLIVARMTRMAVGHTLKAPALFVVGWSADGAEKLADRTPQTGDFGVMISLANSLHIPVFNLQNPDAVKRLVQYLTLDTSKKAVAGAETHEPQRQQPAQHQQQVHQPEAPSFDDSDLSELDF